MKKFILLSMAAGLVMAQVKTVAVTPENIKDYEQIVDIRTKGEWIETGVIDGAKTITFNAFEKDKFVAELLQVFDAKKPIAIICRSGRRSAAAAAAIDSAELDIVNLDGGMGSLINQGYKTIAYK